MEASDGLQCSLAPFDQLSCRSAFRWPGQLIYAEFPDGRRLPFTRAISMSPFQAGLDSYAVESREVFLAPGERRVTIAVEDHLTSFRRDFRIEAFPLAALSRSN